VRDFPTIKYRIDAQDRLVYVNDAWMTEARDAAEITLSSPVILGRGLWQLIPDLAIRQVFELLFLRLRTGQIPQATYLYRCDTPTRRCLKRLTIIPDEERSLDFHTETVAIHDRPRLSLLDHQRPRSGDPLRICSWCKRVPLPGGPWVEIEDAVAQLAILDTGPLPALSHGICPSCETTLKALLDKPSGAGPDIVTFGDWRSN
jgi:hypothetical protein